MSYILFVVLFALYFLHSEQGSGKFFYFTDQKHIPWTLTDISKSKIFLKKAEMQV